MPYNGPRLVPIILGITFDCFQSNLLLIQMYFRNINNITTERLAGTWSAARLSILESAHQAWQHNARSRVTPDACLLSLLSPPLKWERYGVEGHRFTRKRAAKIETGRQTRVKHEASRCSAGINWFDIKVNYLSVKKTSDTEKSRISEDGAGIRGWQGWRHLRSDHVLSATADYSSDSVMGECFC